jgi:formate-dependent nitrite reductase cytochrome c552 subunit
MRRTLGICLRVALLGTMALGVGVRAGAAATDGPYAGADKCGPCHQAIYQAWLTTKHAKALGKLDASQRKSACISCHVTGSPEMIAADGDKPSFPNVQCEACHGAGQAHAQDPNVRAGLTARPDEGDCTRCHNDRSPHFHGFLYSAMKSFVHQTK